MFFEGLADPEQAARGQRPEPAAAGRHLRAAGEARGDDRPSPAHRPANGASQRRQKRRHRQRGAGCRDRG